MYLSVPGTVYLVLFYTVYCVLGTGYIGVAGIGYLVLCIVYWVQGTVYCLLCI